MKHPRLPVWPAWFGIFYIILDLITMSPKLGAWLEDRFGGRVCPMIFEDTRQSDPFLLVAHHRHSFNVLDPLRYVFRSVLLPEGFPAHPHRGFETVTYVLRGGLVHRDSFGVKKSYGAPSEADGSGEGGAVQWMTAGRGLLHEEMWRTGASTDSTDQELFQIWVNLPRRAKMVPPHMQMLGESTPLCPSPGGAGAGADANAESAEAAVMATAGVNTQLVEVRELGQVPRAAPAPGVVVRVISGSAAGVSSPVETYSDVAILHVTMAAGSEWSWPHPMGWTCLVYTRRGEAIVGQPGEVVPVHHTARLGRAAAEVALRAGEEGTDLLILAGAPLNERVEMGGNIVMNEPGEIDQANRDVSAGLFGPSWSHHDDDDSWRMQVTGHWNQIRSLLSTRRH